MNYQYNSILKFPSHTFICECIIYLYTLHVLKFIYLCTGPRMESYHTWSAGISGWMSTVAPEIYMNS